MKSFVGALAVLAVLVVGFFAYQMMLTDIVEQLCTLAETEKIPELSEAFAKAHPFFGVFLNHEEVGGLEDSLTQLQLLQDVPQEMDFKIAKHLFIGQLKTLYENERLKIVNVF